MNKLFLSIIFLVSIIQVNAQKYKNRLVTTTKDAKIYLDKIQDIHLVYSKHTNEDDFMLSVNYKYPKCDLIFHFPLAKIRNNKLVTEDFKKFYISLDYYKGHIFSDYDVKNIEINITKSSKNRLDGFIKAELYGDLNDSSNKNKSFHILISLDNKKYLE